MKLEEAKNIDITQWLARHGYQPAYRKGENWWYLSMLPDRAEHTPSLKVNTRLNRWIDFGNGEKGSLIDLGILYHRCSIRDFLKLLDREPAFQSQHPQTPPAPTANQPTIAVKEVGDLKDFHLLQYLRQRHIPPEIARQYCKEVHYQLGHHLHSAIGLPNRSGGFELRNDRSKASSSPKDISHIINGARTLAVFEGFFDFLSHQTLHPAQPTIPAPATTDQPPHDYLILNSTAFFNKSVPLMLAYDRVHLYLDRDDTGQKLTTAALHLDPQKFVDQSPLYTQYKDLNEMLIHTTRRPQQRPSLGP